MNASFTKIYSLLSNKPFVIYDSRVAAGLGLLVQQFWLKEIESNSSKLFPNLLAFARLDDRVGGANRDASIKDNNILFSKLSGTNKEINHAKWNVYANWVIEAALKDAKNFANETEKLYQMRAVEAALFMVGYNVTRFC